MITEINESKTLTKHISCERKCKSYGTTCNSNLWWNSNKYRCECIKHHICEKDYIWNYSTCNCENGKYLASIMDNSAIICDQITEVDLETKSNDEKTNFHEININCKTQNFYILLAFLLITVALLIAASIYCYLVKY